MSEPMSATEGWMQHLLEPGFGVQLEGEDGVGLEWRVAEIVDEGIVLVGSSATPMPGERVRIAWGSTEGAYRGVTQVLQAEDGETARVVVQRPDHVTKAQRRRFMRVPCTAPFKLLLEGYAQLGATLDVSANGIRGRIRGAAPPREFDLHLVLPFGVVVAHARLVRLRALDHPSRTFEIGLAYTPDPRAEDRIVSYVLERERELVRVRRP